MDQFLEDLISQGVRDVVRIGGRGKGGKILSADDVWQRWITGKPRPGKNVWQERCQLEGAGIWSWTKEARLAAADLWRHEATAEEQASLATHFRTFLRLHQALEAVNNLAKLRVLQNARVIGATTTGAAGMKAILDELAASVILVEEAGEIHEA